MTKQIIPKSQESVDRFYVDLSRYCVKFFRTWQRHVAKAHNNGIVHHGPIRDSRQTGSWTNVFWPRTGPFFFRQVSELWLVPLHPTLTPRPSLALFPLLSCLFDTGLERWVAVVPCLHVHGPYWKTAGRREELMMLVLICFETWSMKQFGSTRFWFQQEQDTVDSFKKTC